ncbi:MAG: glycoside hydrolase family 3 C-terminal domain-containing protein [Thermoleophilia bacterium]|nr:glycoside hydrolase family 3 C-terminal domain-containing protein [Thermoleophilia bacterium]
MNSPETCIRARELCRLLTLEEKLRMLAGSADFYDFALASPSFEQPRPIVVAAAVPRFGLPGIRFTDGPRGVTAGVCTCFPVPIARAATFDYKLEEQIGEAIGREARALGANFVAAPCLNLLRHPAWGRAQETYGENPGHVGEMGAAFVRGLQRHAMACVKHYACNNQDNTRYLLDVRISEEVLEKVYLPHFRRVVEEQPASVMAAYNRVNGEYCAENPFLLTTVLKERWGFAGFVMSDFVFAIRDGVKAINAGLDLEMPSPLFMGLRLKKAVVKGKVSLARVDDAVCRIIGQQLRFATVGDAEHGPEVVACERHRALAREAATRAIVLLRNEVVYEGARAARTGQGGARPTLPLDPAHLNMVAVIGRLAAVPNTGDRGSSNVISPYVVTPLEGLKTALEPQGVRVIYDSGRSPMRAAALAAEADAAIVVVGYDYRDEGEAVGAPPPPGFWRHLPPPPPSKLPRLARQLWRLAGSQAAARRAAAKDLHSHFPGGDRRALTLHEEDEDLILAVAAAKPRTIVVLMCGSPVLMERWREKVPAILILWYPGMDGGHALADIVLGKRAPSGRLPFAIPTSADHLPYFDPDAVEVEYGPLHGQALLDHLGVKAAFPCGFGLTY